MTDLDGEGGWMVAQTDRCEDQDWIVEAALHGFEVP